MSPKLFDTLMVFLKDVLFFFFFLKESILKTNRGYQVMQRENEIENDVSSHKMLQQQISLV